MALVLVAAYLVLLLPVGLWPFSIRIPCDPCENGAILVPGVGIDFVEPGMVLDPEGGMLLYEALSTGSSITIAVSAESAAAAQFGPARIVSNSDSPFLRNFTLGQYDRNLVLRLRTPLNGENGTNNLIVASDVIAPRHTQFLVVTYDGQSARIFVDGEMVSEEALSLGGFSGWDPGYPLIFGNERTGDREWRGIIRDAAVYSRALSKQSAAALRPEDIESASIDRVYHLRSRCPLPASLALPQTQFGACELPETFVNATPVRVLATDPRRVSDFLENFTLYAPAGAALAIAAGSARLRALLLSVAMLHPLLIEFEQVLVLDRTSSARDLLSAWIGLGTGAALALLLVRLWRRRARMRAGGI